MGQLAARVIADIQKGDFTDLWLAGDLLYKVKAEKFRSGSDSIDAEMITPEEGSKLKDVLVEAIQRTDDPDISGSLIWVLGKSCDPAFKQLYIERLMEFVASATDANHTIYQILIALDHIGEDVFDKQETSQGTLNLEKNLRQAENYLAKRNHLGHSTYHSN
jgi:hypothetical protein